MTTIDAMIARSLHEHADRHAVTDAAGTTWTRITVQDDGDSRWHHHRTLVLCDDNGDLWGIGYEVGLTEDQESEYPWQGGVEDVPLARLYPHTAVTTEYRTTPAEVNA